MTQVSTIYGDKQNIECIEASAVVIGSGAAGLNALDRLYDYGIQDAVLVTEHMNAGTSRNTGSDKQTYYKLTLAGEEPDSVRAMADSLFAGGCVDGEHALVEAAMSAPAFFRLVELGVPFPQNAYGEYVGYKTDHDPRQRATSVGPYTSREMTRALERSVRAKNMVLYDHHQAVRLIVHDGAVEGVLCLDLRQMQDDEKRFVVFKSRNIVLATGGPGGLYADSVFPVGHMGSNGLGFRAGAKGKNLTEWQFGLASLKPRWNVSGTYMQVLPTFISTEADGSSPRAFLSDYITDPVDLLSYVFLKGYQWPFDVRKLANGSSLIDMLVWLETSRGRRVFLDFRTNPVEDIPYDRLIPEARAYLENAGACFGTPIERLAKMNQPAIDFYLDKKVDLTSEMLEIALCAQHNNGGLAIDAWWQTEVQGLFAVGEAAASHGIYRPGGSALNAGQVGSARAALFIAEAGRKEPFDEKEFANLLKPILDDVRKLAQSALQNDKSSESVRAWMERTQKRMSLSGGVIRESEAIQKAAEEVYTELQELTQYVYVDNPYELRQVFQLEDLLLSQWVYLLAMADYVEVGGKSRGSALYTDFSGRKPYEFLPDIMCYQLAGEGERTDVVQEIEMLPGGSYSITWRNVHPMPDPDIFFENVWRGFRENRNVFEE